MQLNYPGCQHHEIKALWEWLGDSRRTLEVIGIFGPLPKRVDAVELYPEADFGDSAGGFKQTAAFTVL